MTEQTLTLTESAIQNISVDIIASSPYQTRRIDDQSADMKHLAESIKSKGVIQPVTVRGYTGILNYGFELVCGERRWRASKLAGLHTVPAIFRDLTDQEALEIVTIENLQREDLSPLEQAEGVAQLLEGGFDVDAAAKTLGYTRQWVYTRAQLTKLSPTWREAIAGPVTSGEWDDENTLFPAWGIGHLERVAQLGETAQDDIFQEFRYHTGIPTIKVLQDKIAEMVRQLGKAPFDLDDAELLPAAGTCSLCPKRKGAMPDLFGGVVDEVKKDTCLDQACFQEKIEAHTLRVVEEAKAADPDTIEIEASEWFSDAKIQHKEGKHFRSADTLMEKCRKDDKDAQPAVVTEGAGKGRAIHVRPVKELSELGSYRDRGSTGNRKTIGERRKDLQARREYAAVELFRGALDQIYWADLIEQGIAGWDLIPLLGALGRLDAYYPRGEGDVDSGLWGTTTSFSYRLTSWWQADPEKLQEEIWRFLRNHILKNLPKKDSYVQFRVDDMEVLCDFVGLDWDALLQQAIEQHPEPKSWQGLKAGDYPGAKKSKGKKEAA